MPYSAQWTNRTLVPGGVCATLILTDGAGVLPDVRQEFKFRGKIVSDLTAGFLAPFRDGAKARAIEMFWAAQAESRLRALRDRFLAVREAAITADMQAQFSAQQIQTSDIVTHIQNSWTANGVSGVLSGPVVTIDGTSVYVVNE